MFSNDRFVYIIRHLFTKIRFLLPYSLSTIANDQLIYNRLIADEGIKSLSSYKYQLRESFNLLNNSRYNYIEDLEKLYHKYLSRIREESNGGYDGYGIPLCRMSNSYASISKIYEHSKDRAQRENMEKRRRKRVNYRLRKINMKYKYFKCKGTNQF